MMPIGPLMIEHRLIEKMIARLQREAESLSAGGMPDVAFLAAAVDFVRTYADRTHHGKEEDILFAALAGKPLSPEDRRVMDELTNEHILARRTVAALVAAQAKYLAGDPASLGAITNALAALAGLYPGHIRKEDKVFFPAAMKYFDRSELDAMLMEMARFDQKMIHEKYQKVVKEWG